MEDCSILVVTKKNIIVHNLDIKKLFPKKKLFLEE